MLKSYVRNSEHKWKINVNFKLLSVCRHFLSVDTFCLSTIPGGNVTEKNVTERDRERKRERERERETEREMQIKGSGL